MTIRSVELREVELELRTPFVTAAGTVSHRRILVLRLITDSQEGWAECSADGQPYSAPESSATAWRILVDDLLPGLVAAEAPDPAAVAWDTTGRPM
ncbi:MAG: o-succinylbenzoate synthase, partial [Acidimicrobiia bacterium]|nr:o-succinylbenzoate synthase [Acidimicrobiia bacterium]